MPLNRFRNYQALLNLVPGTTPMAFGNAETDTPARSLATNVNGQANTNNSTRTDGATNMNIWLPNHNMYISPAETIDTGQHLDQQLRRRAGDGRRRRGHGRHQVGHQPVQGLGVRVLQQRQAERQRRTTSARGAEPEKLPVEANTYGGTLGGPIAKNKVFFFGSFEGYKRSRALSRRSSTCRTRRSARATSAEPLNNDGTQQIIYNPFTGDANGTGRQPFANNQIPAGMINPIALKVLQLYPLPNTAGHRAWRADRTTTSARKTARSTATTTTSRSTGTARPRTRSGASSAT